MPFPISLIFNFLMKKGLDKDAAGPVAWVIAAIILALAFLAGKAIYDASVISDHETEQRAEEAEKTIEQIETAEEVDEQLRDRDDKTIDDMEDERNDADIQNPSRTSDPVDDGTTAIHDRMRQHSSTGSPR